jgi:hypothetical protein
MLTWNGYEVDGSDTTFTVDMPGESDAWDAARVVLDLPLWRRSGPVELRPHSDWAPHRVVAQKSETLDFGALRARLAARTLGPCDILLTALPPLELKPDVLASLVALSAGREPLEPDYCLARAAVHLPDGDWFSAEVALVVPAPAEALSAKPLAKQLLDAKAARCLEITLGPTFIYEYAMRIAEALTASGAEVSGGLDCANGWTWGCTYAASLYPFVKVTISGDIERVVEEVLATTWFSRPLLTKGFKGTAWYKQKQLPPAHHIQLAGGCDAQLIHLEQHPDTYLAGLIEEAVNRSGQLDGARYAELCRLAAPLEGAVRRNLTLAYLSLAQPPDDLRQRQLAKIRAIGYAGCLEQFDAAAKDASFFACGSRIAWLGLNDTGEGMALWVRPTLEVCARGLIHRMQDNLGPA